MLRVLVECTMVVRSFLHWHFFYRLPIQIFRVSLLTSICRSPSVFTGVSAISFGEELGYNRTAASAANYRNTKPKEISFMKSSTTEANFQ
jgi:hypothetical protein